MTMIDLHRRTVGVNFNEEGIAVVVVWAPHAEHVFLNVHPGNKSLPLRRSELGYWRIETNEIKPGDRYTFLVDGRQLPDPASLSQPDGVHEPSKSIDLAQLKPKTSKWVNPPLKDYIIYELHTGTFTQQGTFEGIAERLDHLVGLGITAVELMPVASFPGTRNWGYDGVYPFSVQESYGGISGLAELIDTCHSKGLAVILDVVYNHLGPEGNYFSAYGPYFTDKYKTPWGAAVNFDDEWCDEVRNYFVENAMMWFRDLGVDALRLDAVHAIKDFSARHILQEIAEYTHQLSVMTGKSHYLIGECDLNDPKYIRPVEQYGLGLHSQWADEFHHALRTSAGQAAEGYYSDFNGVYHLAKAYRDAYVYDGQYSVHRKKTFGLPTRAHGKQFVVFSQNHDQVGNRMLGERTSTLNSFEMRKLLASCVLVSPFIPLLFMGEEWSEMNPFQYFVSHTDPELAELVSQGRRKEFESFQGQGEAPDPMDPETFKASCLQWDLVNTEPHKTMLDYYKSLIDLRKRWLNMAGTAREGVTATADPEKETLQLQRQESDYSIFCFMNFSLTMQAVGTPASLSAAELLIDSADPRWLGPGISVLDIAANTLHLRPESIAVYILNNV